MSEKFQKVQKHLYRRTYTTATGEEVTKHYAKFTCWDGIYRTFALGEDLQDAIDELGRLKTLNKGRYDFDHEKHEKEKAKKAMTLSVWLDRYLDLVKMMPSYETKRAQCVPLKRILGNLLLSEVNKVRILEYKNRRLLEPVVRGKDGKPVEGTRIAGSTVNREVSCLNAALNLAADEGLCEEAPKVKKERETARERTLTDQEYESILEVSHRWLQRVIIAANETAIDQGVLLRLTWDQVKDGLIVIKGGRGKTGMRQAVGISPALKAVLDELRAEYRKIPNTEKRVFTKDGKPITKDTLRDPFDRAVAEVEDFQFRDFRHCARTRWSRAGLPFEVAEIGMGHTLKGIAGRYVNLTEDHIRDAFKEMFQKFSTSPQQAEESNDRSKAGVSK